MKLRTTHNSIRIRIRKSELSTLKEKSRVEESIHFPNGIVFKFILQVADRLENLSANLDDNNLIISIPKDKATHWMSTNEVSIETNIDLEGGASLHLLVEKDFPCMDRVEEDKSDTFWELAPDSK